jgi:hypothetical protein
VTDASGAVIPGVAITAVHQATGNKFAAVTDERGVYRAARPHLPADAELRDSGLSREKQAACRTSDDRQLADVEATAAGL